MWFLGTLSLNTGGGPISPPPSDLRENLKHSYKVIVQLWARLELTQYQISVSVNITDIWLRYYTDTDTDIWLRQYTYKDTDTNIWLRIPTDT